MQSLSSSPILAQQEAKRTQALEREIESSNALMISFAKPRRFSPRSNSKLRSTADKSDGSVHPRPQTCVWGRGDLQSVADRIAPSPCHVHQARRSHLELRSEREKRDAWLCEEIRRVWKKSFGGVCGARKIWRQLKQEGIEVARCTVEHLMQYIGLQQAIPRRVCKGTTPSDNTANKPKDLVKRNFEASRPNQLWVVDLTDVATWKGFAYVAVVIDVFSRKIAGWRVMTSLKTTIALDALAQALCARKPEKGLIHHSEVHYSIGHAICVDTLQRTLGRSGC